MNSLPSGWTVKPLGEVATLQRGFDLPIHERTPGNVPVLAANGPVGTHNVARVKGPGVVTGRSGTLGEVHYVESDFWALNTALWVKDFHGNDPKWIARLLKWMKLEAHTRGTGVPTLNRNLVHVVPVLVPPLDEQRRIAAILDRADAIRRKRQEAIALTEELLRSTFLEMFGDPVTNPKEWEAVTVGDIVSDVRDGPHVSPKYSDSNDAIPILSTRNIRPGRLIMEDVKFISKATYQDLVKSFRPQCGDVLLTKGGTTGYAKTVDWNWAFAIWVHIAALRPTKKIRPEFLEAALNTPNCYAQSQKFTHGIANRDLGLTRIRKIQLSLPPLDLQNQYCAFRQTVLSQMRSQEKSSDKANDLFNSLLQRAFRGDL